MRKKLTIEFIKRDFEGKGYILVTKYYNNAKQKLEYICSNGHRNSMCWNNWKSGKRCPTCANEIRVIKLRKNFDTIKRSFIENSYILLTTKYSGNNQKLKYICPKSHKHSVAWTKWQQGRRCPKCSNKISKWEMEIKKFISDIKVGFVANDRTQIINPKTNCGLELDVWFPQLNKAIECNGVYWHSLEQAIIRDQIKQQLCTEQGIDLLVVTDKEWKTDIEKCKIKLVSFIETGVFDAR